MNKRAYYLGYMDKVARTLKPSDRAHIKKENFGIPSKAEGKEEKKKSGNYPIHDKAHARAALSYGSRYLSADDYKALKARIHAKYPSMSKESIEKIAGPVMRNVSELIHDTMDDSPTAATVTDIGSYFVPVVGSARMGYDAVADASNMFGKDLSWKQRAGYGLSSGANALFAGLSLAADAGTVGLGGAPVRWASKPVLAVLSKLKSGPKILKALKKARVGYKTIGRGIRQTAVKNPVGKFYFGTNPYKFMIDPKTGKKIYRTGFANKAKQIGYGALRQGSYMVPVFGAGSMIGEPSPKQEEYPNEFYQ